jgi:hypothetical protein
MFHGVQIMKFRAIEILTLGHLYRLEKIYKYPTYGTLDTDVSPNYLTLHYLYCINTV